MVDSEKSDLQKAYEHGQRDGSVEDWYFAGWMYSGEELEAYRKGYRNGKNNPANRDEVTERQQKQDGESQDTADSVFEQSIDEEEQAQGLLGNASDSAQSSSSSAYSSYRARTYGSEDAMGCLRPIAAIVGYFVFCFWVMAADDVHWVFWILAVPGILISTAIIAVVSFFGMFVEAFAS